MKGIYSLSKYLFVALGIMCMVPMTAISQTFKHYQGIANKEGDYEIINQAEGRMRQKTHEYHYYIPVQQGGSTNLVLPIVNFAVPNTKGVYGDPLEPRGFFRWYNYKTDAKSENLSIPTAYTSTSKLVEMHDGNGINKGLVAYNIVQDACIKNVGVTYIRPTDSNWKGEIVACDVSRYVDGMTNGTFNHEPTLSMRYIYHMIPAEKMADDMMNAVIAGTQSAANDLTYEDNKVISVGVKDGNSKVALRLNQNDAGNYYFHPMNADPTTSSHHVFYNDDKYKIQASDFDQSKLLKANKIQWRIYNSDKTMCALFTYTISSSISSSRFFDLTLNLFNNANGWSKLDGTSVSANEKPSITYGGRVYVVAYACADNYKQMCPIANFTVTFYNGYPMTAEQLRNNHINTRLISYLDEHYRSVANVSFDDDDTEQTLEAPTSPNDNQDRLPSKWKRRSYGFVYRDLLDKTASGTKNDFWHDPKHSPLHGEYGLYKSANIKGISGQGQGSTDGYLWYQSGQLYDRTCENTNGAQYGHFLYVDAADESRQIAEADFKANLCVGSQVIFSSAISDMTSGEVKPEVMFKLYGVHYDENNNETDRKLLHSFSTGYLKGNVDEYATCKWYQGYGKMILQKESGVNNYEDFKLVVDNLCKGTGGADYAFDDLRIYTQASKVDVIQSTPICPSVDINQGYNPQTMGNVKLKIRALQETMAALADHTEKKLYFRFVDVNTGKPTTDVNYATSGEPDYKWGSTTIHTEVDNGAHIDGASMYEKLNDEWYVVLANRNFNLNPNKKYYLSFAFDDESVTDKNQLNWGKPSDVCSLYSDEFNMVQQSVVVTDANGNIATAVTIPCDDNAIPEYDIKAQLQTVDQNNGGTINLQSIKFNWYVDNIHSNPVLTDATEFRNISLSEGEHTIYVEPTNTNATVTEGGVNYEICLEMMSFKIRAVKNGPKLQFGFSDVVYPDNYERTIRVGLPQIKELAKQGAGKGYFKIPVSYKNFIVNESQNLQFIEAPDQANPVLTTTVYLSDTNDPMYAKLSNMTSLKLGELQSSNLAKDATTLNMKFMPQQDNQYADDGTVQLHEGYWYEGALIFNEDGKDNTKVLCSGEAFLKFEIVPEYVTWYPTAKGQKSAAWNNDQNWVRSTREELNKKDVDYVNYIGGIASEPDEENGINELDIPRQNSYVPMKFTKVVIPNLSGLYFPDLGYIAYRQSNQIATKLSNSRGDEATTNIQYAILAKWDANSASHGLDADGNLACEKFYGNTCDQIYFKPGGELLDQCYLIYNKAWVEKELKPNTWYAMTSPLKNVYAGDMYVPNTDGRQQTEAFLPISFDESVNDRVNYPFYQRSWDKSDVEEVTSSNGSYPAYDYAGTGISADFNSQNLKTVTANWSHVYNKVDKSYDTFEGFALKVGDHYMMTSLANNALVRLPKADVAYTYYDGKSQKQQTSANLDRTGSYRLNVAESTSEGSLSAMRASLPSLTSGNSYYLVGNPYMSTLSMYYFLRANSTLSPSIYVYEDGALKTYTVDTSVAYDTKVDVKISPMQSFFVKFKDGEQARDLSFTSGMTIDREMFVGRNARQQADAPASLAITASKAGYSSQAKVQVSDEASEDYDSSEDTELLYDTNLKEVPTVYTVAGEQTVALNAVPSIQWLPLGVICQQVPHDASLSSSASMQDDEVALSFQGIGKLDAPLYLYDAENKQYQQLEDQTTISIMPNEHGRYFLTTTRGTTGIESAITDENAIKVYSPVAGILVVSSPEAILNKVEVFTVDGKLVATRQLQNATTVSIPVGASAVYIVKVTTSLDNNKVFTRKLSIR